MTGRVWAGASVAIVAIIAGCAAYVHTPAPTPTGPTPTATASQSQSPWRDQEFSAIMQQRPDIVGLRPMHLWQEAGQLVCSAYGSGGAAEMQQTAVAVAGSSEAGGYLWGASRLAYCPQYPLA